MAMKRKRDSVGSNTSKGIRKRKKEVDEPKVYPLETTLADLPYDIVTSILLKLPMQSVLICKCVCKSWHSIISDKYFAQFRFECEPITVLVHTNDSKRVSRTLHQLNLDEFKSNITQNSLSDNDCAHSCSCKDSPTSISDNHLKLELKFKLPLRDSKMVIDTLLGAKMRGKKRTNIACKPRDDKFDIVNSCNGLLCLCSHIKSNEFVIANPMTMTLVVCNPITGEFIRLPQSDIDKPMGYLYIYSGLGYLKKSNEYKVIRICIHDFLLNDGVVEVHTLGIGIWRNIQYLGPFWRKLISPTCLNGTLHWLVSDLGKYQFYVLT